MLGETVADVDGYINRTAALAEKGTPLLDALSRSSRAIVESVGALDNRGSLRAHAPRDDFGRHALQHHAVSAPVVLGEGRGDRLHIVILDVAAIESDRQLVSLAHVTKVRGDLDVNVLLRYV